ncbi:hypothetical protein WA026_011317 [Henosepilachna vigintioctopunctata]|uniref:Reverse transcriptase domain-containing protein n=1 Tax=Henosepilachna vigintioctopunctata TaxID=420089 RepID=A0AAW1U8E8_9CUCU
MLKFIFDTTIFSFGGVYYKQREGTPMGSLVSPIVAQYIVDYILNKSIEQFPFQVPFCKKFVDDIMTSVPRNCINEALQILNAVDSSVVQGTDDNENMNDIDQSETKEWKEHIEEHIIYTSLPYLKNMTQGLRDFFITP